MCGGAPTVLLAQLVRAQCLYLSISRNFDVSSATLMSPVRARYGTLLICPSRSKGAVLRTVGVFVSWVRTPLSTGLRVDVTLSERLIRGSNPLGSGTYSSVVERSFSKRKVLRSKLSWCTLCSPITQLVRVYGC